jgi:hypothetical protein
MPMAIFGPFSQSITEEKTYAYFKQDGTTAQKAIYSMF